MLADGDEPGRNIHPGRGPIARRRGSRNEIVVAQALADSFADGRLDPAEFDRCSTAVVGSKTLGDLLDSLSDLLPTKIERRPTAIVQPRRNLLPAVFGTAFFVMFIATFVVVLFGFFVIFMQF